MRRLGDIFFMRYSLNCSIEWVFVFLVGPFLVLELAENVYTLRIFFGIFALRFQDGGQAISVILFFDETA
jgi:hypothetical protein